MAAKRRIPIALKVLFGIVGAMVLAFGIYVAYLQVNYTRIPDNVEIANEGVASTEVDASLSRGQTYTAMTYNIGFGAYTPDFSFFMDTGMTKDGVETQGEHGKAVSEQSVRACTDGVVKVAQELVDGSPANFMLFQEVDENSTRSFHVDQRAILEESFMRYEAFFARNFHSGYLIYPLHDPHGSVLSGLLTLSSVNATAARRSYPVNGSFPTRFTDLDRCFTVLRVPVGGGGELVLINSHMSAYDETGVVRQEQMDLLMGVMAQEYAAGNYVIAGGDWNHALCNSQDLYESDEIMPNWISIMDESELPKGFSVVRAQNLAEVATCRSADMPYERGHTYRVTIDGFIVSDNVKAEATNMDTGYAYSDHDPVKLSFELL